MIFSEILPHIRQAANQREKKTLISRATFSRAAIRRHTEDSLQNDYRWPFALDVDRILHSGAYARYIDKTQVFYLIKNDHITHRVLHVQLVSKIGRTIGRYIGLNEDLIEAIALGHDIGHTPFGHDGERFLSKLCRLEGIGNFFHNVQSIQFLDKLERKGKGLNLCLQTLDGILCHDGELHNQRLEPLQSKSFESIDKSIEHKIHNPDYKLMPMTLEGCVVRMADTVSYIGRDFEDAIRLNLIKRSDMPAEISERLGNTNGTIVYTLVTDLINNSFDRPYIAFSREVGTALENFKKFNLKQIYLNPEIKQQTRCLNELFEKLFTKYLSDLEQGKSSSVIFSTFLKDISDNYLKQHSNPEIVRDFIAGMTDSYFLEQFPPDQRPGPVIINCRADHFI